MMISIDKIKSMDKSSFIYRCNNKYLTPIKYFYLYIIGNIILIHTIANPTYAQTGAVTHVHDPCIINSGDYYYIFSTGDRIEMRRSNDLQYWRRLNQVFQSIPE